ncbi:MAG: rhodanese-like domain-containing protein [Gammaproteobacteria bacterium]|nr:rhodanese-like domain-containing protein [Gammaproteobacteria bacterium]
MHEYLDFAGRHWALFVALGIILALIVFEEIRRRRASVHELLPTAAVQMLNRGATVLDCRKADDYGKGHIVGARNLSLEGLDTQADKLKVKRDKPILAVGAAPRDASRAATALRRAGFTSVYVIKGGLDAWRKENLPLEQGEDRPVKAKKQPGKKKSRKSA